MSSSPFTNSFSQGNTKVSTTTASMPRPNFQTGALIDDLVKHYVRPSTQVMSTVQNSANGNPIPGHGALDANFAKTVNDRRDIKNILAMNPNAQLAIDIIVNGTLSPNNTLDSSLQYKSSYDKLGTIKSALLQKIRDCMNDYTELEDKLPTILRDAKYDVGSYALLVVPMARVKQLINEERTNKKGSKASPIKLESVDNALNLFATGKHDAQKTNQRLKTQVIDIKLEDLGIKSDAKDKAPELGTITIHSDLSVIRLNRLKERMIKQESQYDCLAGLAEYSSYNIADDLPKQESLTQQQIDESLATAKSYSQDDVLVIDPVDDFESMDLPIHMHVPHEAIFVVHKPGSPEDHIGYFIALDLSGNPISIAGELNIYSPVYSGIYGNDATSSAMGGQANFAAGNMELGYSGFANNGVAGRRLSDKNALFTRILDQKINKELKESNYIGSDISLSTKKELMEMMYTRLLSNKQTQLLYVPASLMTYYAFDYDDNGNGLSLVIKHKNIGVFNSILTLANTVAAVNNTIDYKEVKIKFDEDEIDVNERMEQIAGNLARYTTLNASRLMNTDVNTQVDYLGMSGYQFAFEEHPHLPGTTVSIDSLNRERTMPDPDVVEKNEALLIQGLGSTPEVVDMARNVEFASSYFQSNLQAARRGIADQKILTRFTNKFIRVYVMNAPIILKYLIDTIDKKRADLPEIKGIKTIEVVRAFVSSITVALPRPDMVKVEALDKAIQSQEQLLDHVLKYTIGEEAVQGADVGENLEEVLTALRYKVKALAMREWMASNSMFNEGFFSGLFNGDREEVDAAVSKIEEQQEFIVDVLSSHKILTSDFISKINNRTQKVLDARGTDETGGSATTTTTTDTSTDTTATNDGGANDSDPFGSMGGDGEAGGDNAPADGGDGGGEDPFA